MRWTPLARKILIVFLLFIAVAVVTVATLNTWRTERAEAAYPPAGQFVTVDGAKVHYVQNGSGPDLVLLHGAGGTLRDFTFDLMDRLTPHYRVTAFDRPGAGYSDRVPGTRTGPFTTDGESPAEQAAHLRAAARQLGVQNPVVVGHSFGGIVAMGWALEGLDHEAPENASAIVSLAGVLMPWPGDLGAYYTVNGGPFGFLTVPVLMVFAGQDRVDAAINNTFRPQQAPPGYADHIGGQLSVRVPVFLANARQVNGLYPHVIEMAKRYGALSLPMEILHGTADESVPISVHPYAFRELTDIANLTELPGVGHMPHHIDPEAAIAAIDRAVDRAGLR